MTENEIIASCLKELELPAIKDLLEDVIADATEQNWSFRKFLCTLLMREMEQRVENRKYQRIRKACFPQMNCSSVICRYGPEASHNNNNKPPVHKVGKLILLT